MEYHSLLVILAIVCSDDKTMVLVICLSNDRFRAEAPEAIFYSTLARWPEEGRKGGKRS